MIEIEIEVDSLDKKKFYLYRKMAAKLANKLLKYDFEIFENKNENKIKYIVMDSKMILFLRKDRSEVCSLHHYLGFYSLSEKSEQWFEDILQGLDSHREIRNSKKSL